MKKEKQTESKKEVEYINKKLLALYNAQKYEFDRIAEHVGHTIECVMYGENVNVSIECVDCNAVLYDLDNPEECDEFCIKCGKTGSYPDSMCESCYAIRN